MQAAGAFLAVLFALLAGIRASALWRRPSFTPVERALAALSLAAALLLGSFHLLGALHLITGVRAVSAGHAALVLAAALAAVFAVTGRISRRLADPPWVEAVPHAGRWLPAGFVALTLLLLAPGYLLAWTAALTRPPIGTDVLWYHLPMAANWIQHRSLDIEGIVSRPEPGMEVPLDAAVFCYAGNGSVMSMLPLSAGLEILVPFVQVPALLAAALAAWALARRAGLSPAGALLAAAGFLSTPMLILQSAIAQNDLTQAGFQLVAVAFLLAAIQTASHDPPAAVLAAVAGGAAGGVAAGTKLNALAALCLCTAAAPFLFLLVNRARMRLLPAARSAILVVVLFVLCGAAAGSFWYARNAALLHNPLFPFGVELFGARLVEGQETNRDWGKHGEAREAEGATLNPWAERRHLTYYRGMGAVLGLAVPLGALVGAVALLAGARRRREGRAGWRIGTGLCVAAFFAADFLPVRLLASPAPRYLFVSMAILCLLAGVLHDALRGAWRGAAIVLVLALAGGNSAAVAIRTVLSGDWDIAFGAASTHQGFYGVPAALDALPPGSTILNELDSGHKPLLFNYPLFGTRLQNRVSNEVEPQADTPGETHRRLRARGIDHVFVHTVAGAPWPERYDDPALFRIVAEESREGSYWYAARAIGSANWRLDTRLYRLAGDGEQAPAP